MKKIAKGLKITESDIQQQIKEYLQWHGWFVIKIHQSLGSHKGIFDLYAIKNGFSVWIEIKTENGKLSKDQKQFMTDIESHGGTCIVATGIEDVEMLVKKKRYLDEQDFWD